MYLNLALQSSVTYRVEGKQHAVSGGSDEERFVAVSRAVIDANSDDRGRHSITGLSSHVDQVRSGSTEADQ